MLVFYFVPFIVSNRYLLFWVSNGHNSVTVQNRTHVYINFFDRKDLGNHLLQLCPKVVKHPVYENNIEINPNEKCGKLCTGFIWLKAEPSDMLLTQWWPSSSRNLGGNFSSSSQNIGSYRVGENINALKFIYWTNAIKRLCNAVC